MQSGNVTTPFGRRSMTLAMLATQLTASDIEPNSSVDKWKLFRSLCEARTMIGVSDRTLAVLNALLTFHPKNELSEEGGLVVFPSNMQLSLRTHGMAGTTLRRHLAALVDAGLISRKDSPNGKRYARKDGVGAISDAYGFNLAPLLARSAEIEHLAAEVMAERLLVKRLKEQLTLCRRDVSKLVETAMEEGLPGDWIAMQVQLRLIGGQLSRSPQPEELRESLKGLEAFREQVVKILKSKINLQDMGGNDSQNGHHIQNSNPHQPTESETANENENENENEKTKSGPTEKSHIHKTQGKPFPLAIVLQACPEISIYGPGGAVSSWRDLVTAAIVVRSMLGVSPSAYERASEVMGAENAATVIACILERAGHINSAGGYLRDLTTKAERGEFSLTPMLMALMRNNAGEGRRAG